MNDLVELVLEELNDSMKKAVAHLESELTRIRAGKATPNIVDGITVEYYGSPTPIGQVANVTVVDARTLAIQPWERNMIAPIEKSIIAANIGLTPQNDGAVIRLFLPIQTEERRKELVKRAMGEGEHGKVSVRNIRRDAIEHIKKMQKDGLSEDLARSTETQIQGVTDKFIALIEQHLKDKEKEIMTV